MPGDDVVLSFPDDSGTADYKALSEGKKSTSPIAAPAEREGLLMVILL
jgi:hypothetical protein